MDKKYRIEEASADDQKAFNDGLNKLLAELSLTATLAIVKKGIAVKNEKGETENVFGDQPTLILQKRIEEVVAEKTSETETTEPTISPFVAQPNDNPETTN